MAWRDDLALDRGLSCGPVCGDVVERAPLVSKTIRIMTWNVHGTFNLNPHFDIDGVCAIIERWAPDIVALQEVDSRGRSDDIFGRLADAVGEHRVEARSIVAEDGHYGQALLSRWPFAAEPKITDVSYQEREPRRAISASVRCPLGEITVIATHLGLSMHERYAQARAIVDLIDKRRSIVLGDFNDWFWVKSVRRVLASHCPVRTRLRTFPSRLPVLRLDRIYATPDGNIVNAWTDSKACAYSDHLPVLADIDFSDRSVIHR
jgi:endonuclease/exonuclease/phosphatase family metal-dependent hydrolase